MQHVLCFIITYWRRRVIKHYLLLSLFIYSTGLPAQPSGTDSLRLLLKQTLNDSLRCRILTTLSETAPDGEWEKDNEQLKLLASQAFYRTKSLSLKTVYLHCFALALNNEGVILGRMDLPTEEERLYRAAYRLFKAIKDSSGMATAISNIGTKYMMRSEHETALRFFRQSLFISEAMKDQSGKARALMSLGDIYQQTSRLSMALTCYEQCLSLSQAINDEWQLALVLRRITQIYFILHEDEKTRRYLKKSMDICKKAGDMEGYSEALNFLSVIDLSEKKYDLAEKGFQECLVLNKRYGFHVRDGESLLHLAEIRLRHHRNATEALSYLLKARDALHKGSKLHGPVLRFMSDVYLHQGKPDSALLYGNESLRLCMLHRNAEAAVKVSGTLKGIYEKKQDYRKAYELSNLISRLNDSLYSEEHRLSAVRSQYRSEYMMKAATDSLTVLREKAILESRIGNEQKNRYLLILSFTVLMLLLWLALQKFRQSQKLKVVALRNEIANDLHDEIGASISSIKFSAGFGSRSSDQQEREHALKNIEQTSQEIARSISDIIWSIKPGNDDFILMLTKMQRFGQELCFHTDMSFSFRYNPGEADPVFTYMERKHIYLIYREALHNAVKHSGAKKLSVLIAFHDRVFSLKVSDDGRGFDPTQVKSGNGQLSMKERAEAIGGSLQVISKIGQHTDIILEYRMMRSMRHQA